MVQYLNCFEIRDYKSWRVKNSRFKLWKK